MICTAGGGGGGLKLALGPTELGWTQGVVPAGSSAPRPLNQHPFPPRTQGSIQTGGTHLLLLVVVIDKQVLLLLSNNLRLEDCFYFYFDYSKAFSRSAANWRATLMVRSRWVLFTGTPSVLASARAKRMIVLICRLCGHHITSSTTRRSNR